MGRLAGFTYWDITRKLRKLGYAYDRQGAGSHELWRHLELGGKVAVPRHPGDMKEGTLRVILRQAGISVEEFLEA